MPVSNPRWLIDGLPATSFVYGRKAELAVDVQNTPTTEITFKLQKTVVVTVSSARAGAAPARGSTAVIAPVMPVRTHGR